MGNLNQRLEKLEGKETRIAGNKEAEAFCAKLLAFLEQVFPSKSAACRMDDLARCCGLPSAPAMREAFDLGLDEAAFSQVSAARYEGDWQAQMQATMDRALDQVREVHGTDGPLHLATLFPPILAASMVATSEQYRSQEVS